MPGVVAGSVPLGRITITDYIVSSTIPRSNDPAEQDNLVREFAGGIAKLRAAFWDELKVAEPEWSPAVLNALDCCTRFARATNLACALFRPGARHATRTQNAGRLVGGVLRKCVFSPTAALRKAIRLLASPRRARARPRPQRDRL